MAKLIKILLLLALLWVALLYKFSLTVPLSATQNLNKVDAIVVLTGGSDRIEQGFSLLKQGRAERLFISGVWRDVDKNNVLEKYNIQDYKDKIKFDYKSSSTRQNAINTAKWMEQENIKTILLVTANYHMPRSMLEFNRYRQGIDITAFPVFPEQFKVNAWWKDSLSTKLMISEFHKYWIVYLFRKASS